MHLVTLQLEGRQTARVHPNAIVQVQPRGNDETLVWIDKDQIPMVVAEPLVEVHARINDAMAMGSEFHKLEDVLEAINTNMVDALKDFKHSLFTLTLVTGAAGMVFFILLLVVFAHGGK